MRLNRVLLLAATVNILIFALLFTISCSGEDGKPGKNGTDCTVEADGDAFKVLCGGEEIGVLQGTADRDGKNGPNGTDGKDGSYCVVGTSLTAAGGFEIKCNGEVKGTLDACDIKDLSNRELQVSCGKTKLSTCDGIVFDPTKKFCPTLAGAPLSDVKNNLGTCQGDAKPNTRNKTTEYCGYASEKATKRTKLPKCHYAIPDELQPNAGTDFIDVYSTEKECVDAGGDTVITHVYYGDVCTVRGNTSDLASGYVDCLTTDPADKIVAGTITTVQGYNVGKEKRRLYSACILNLKDLTRKLGTTVDDIAVSDDAQGCKMLGGEIIPKGADPNTLTSSSYNIRCVSTFQNQYCRYLSQKPTVFPTVSDELCGGAKLNEGKWKGEYCGYLEKVNGKGFIKGVQTGLCDDYEENMTLSPTVVTPSASNPTGQTFTCKAGAQCLGPNQKNFGAGYCEVLYKDKLSNKTSYSENLCGTTSKNKPNNGKWAKEYCGGSVVTVNSSSSVVPRSKVYNDICDDGNGPMENYNKTNYCEVTFKNRLTGFTTVQTSTCGASGQPNKGTWQGQYCGYKNDKSNGPDKVYSGICDDGSGPNENGYNKDEYCQSQKNGKTFLSTFACDDGNKINEKDWKTEYCGVPDKDSTSTTRQTGGCGDDRGPNSESFGGGYCQAINKKGDLEYTSIFCGEEGKPNDGEWKGEYCGYASATSAGPDKIYSGACDNGGGPNAGGFESGYCRWTTESSTGTEFTDALCGGAKINEGEWKGEYCYSDDKVAVCTGGRIPNVDKKSTDPFTVRCSFTSNDLVCSDSNLKFCDKDGCDDLGSSYKWDEEAFECRALESAE
ncbi:MAG: hypothetical protein LBC75_08535 [Fibromonadaceae bacterium]|jgi:hypothetical protein|nr:hypothetical protein [Fibromonadaceae bacterium]